MYLCVCVVQILPFNIFYKESYGVAQYPPQDYLFMTFKYSRMSGIILKYHTPSNINNI